MKALIVDDDKQLATMLKTLLSKFFSEFLTIDLAHSVEDGKQAINDTNYDLLLLDIHLQDGISFDFLDQYIASNTKIIFISGHENYAMDALKLRAVDYILKPISIPEFKAAVSKALKDIQSAHINTMASIEELQNKSISLKDIEEIKILRLNDIIYFEAAGPYTNVFFGNNEKFVVSKNLKEFELRLTSAGFYRVHNSFLVNTLKIKNINKKDGFYLEMTNGEKIIVSTRKKDEFMNYIEKNLEI